MSVSDTLAGIDLVAPIERYAQRVVHMHLKVLDAATFGYELRLGATFQEMVVTCIFVPLV